MSAPLNRHLDGVACGAVPAVALDAELRVGHESSFGHEPYSPDEFKRFLLQIASNLALERSEHLSQEEPNSV
jgi:hypothetical protein